VHELVVLAPHAGLEVDGDETLGEQVVVGAVPTEVITRSRLDRQIDESEFHVDRDLRSDSGVAGVDGGVVQPALAFQIDEAIVAEAENRTAGRGFERDHPVA
jgi:hypothetical protein